MGDLLELMAAPFAVCVVLVGIHSYLGMHVIQRKVIFVDLALAQIAALGATFSFLLGISPHGRGAYFFALGFAIVGAAVFALTRMRHERIPQEAIIGIVYAVALAAAILVADRAPEGAEHIKESLVGAILWVTWPTVLKTAAIYLAVGAIHVALRRRFLQISFEPERAYAEKRNVRAWDFIFYITFAFVITSSVAIAGVLLVFSFLVIPAVVATLFATDIVRRLIVGWSVGIAACLVGMVASYRFDLPSGPAVVVTMGFSLALAGLFYYVREADNRSSALLKVVGGAALLTGVAVTLAIFLAPGRLAQIEHDHEWEAHAEELDFHECGEDLVCQAASLQTSDRWQEHVKDHLDDPDPAVREHLAKLLGEVGSAEGLALLAAIVPTEPDPLLRLEFAGILVDAGHHGGLETIVGLLADDVPPLVRDDAHRLLLDESGSDFGYDPMADAATNEGPIRLWREWVASGG